MNKALTFLLTGLLAVTTLTGCGGGSDEMTIGEYDAAAAEAENAKEQEWAESEETEEGQSSEGGG